MRTLGHRRIGLVTGPAQQFATGVRHDGFVEAFVKLGGSRSEIRSVSAQRGAILEIGYAAAQALLADENRPTAVFAFNDELAAGVLAYARANGLSVPGDLAIAGFDDSDAARLTWPAITTIRQPIAEMAQAAVDLLTARPAATHPQQVLCPVELIVRGSTDPRAEAEHAPIESPPPVLP